MGLPKAALPSIALVLTSESVVVPERSSAIRFEAPIVQSYYQPPRKCLMTTIDEADETDGAAVTFRLSNDSESTFGPKFQVEDSQETLRDRSVVERGAKSPSKRFVKFIQKFRLFTKLQATTKAGP